MATTTLQLRWLAHARSGDKGDAANVGLIALDPDFYDVLRRTKHYMEIDAAVKWLAW